MGWDKTITTSTTHTIIPLNLLLLLLLLHSACPSGPLGTLPHSGRLLGLKLSWVPDTGLLNECMDGPAAAAAAKSLQSCPTLCDPKDALLPGSSVPGILQARTLEWVAISFSNAWKWKVKVKSLSCVRFLATSWTAAHQAPPSMGFSRQEYWSGVPLPSPIQGT